MTPTSSNTSACRQQDVTKLQADRPEQEDGTDGKCHRRQPSHKVDRPLSVCLSVCMCGCPSIERNWVFGGAAIFNSQRTVWLFFWSCGFVVGTRKTGRKTRHEQGGAIIGTTVTVPTHCLLALSLSLSHSLLLTRTHKHTYIQQWHAQASPHG